MRKSSKVSYIFLRWENVLKNFLIEMGHLGSLSPSTSLFYPLYQTPVIVTTLKWNKGVKAKKIVIQF